MNQPKQISNSPRTNTPQKGQAFQSDNFVESIRDIGSGTMNSFKEDLLKQTSKDFLNQLFGLEKTQPKASGELIMGKSVFIDRELNEQKEENVILRQQLTRERQLRDEDKVVSQNETKELKLKLQAITTETETLAKQTVQLSQEVKIAAIQHTVEPGIYHIVFFEQLLNFIKSFRKKIENANLWIQTQNKKASKRHTFWGQVQKSGAKRLLSNEDNVVRSAG